MNRSPDRTRRHPHPSAGVPADRRARLRWPAVVLLAGMVLSGCRTEVVTTVEALASGTVAVSTATSLSGDAAVAVTRGDRLDRLQQLHGRYHPDSAVTVDRDDGRITVSSHGNADALATTVTGLAAVELSEAPTSRDRDDDGRQQLTVTLTAPDQLRAVLIDTLADDDGVEGGRDPAALQAAILGTTIIEHRIVFAGGIDQVTVSGDLPVEVGETVAVVRQPLSEYQDGTLEVIGIAGRPLLSVRTVAAIAIVAATAAAVLFDRRRSRKTAPPSSAGSRLPDAGVRW